MKTIAISTRLLLAAVLIVATQGLFAQTDEAKKDSSKYRLHIVRDENGKKEVIDKAFETKTEMDNYIKQNNFDAADELALPAADEKGKKNDKQNSKKEKKIVIIEKDESGLNKDIDLEIGASALNENERLELIQQLLNIKPGKVHLIQITKTAPAGKSESVNTETAQPPSAIAEPGEATLAGVKVYPNPSTGQFHVSFTVNKPSAVKLRITDLQGKEVYAYALNNYSGVFDKDIIRPGLPNGTYLLDIEAGGEKETTKVVMQ